MTGSQVALLVALLGSVAIAVQGAGADLGDITHGAVYCELWWGTGEKNELGQLVTSVSYQNSADCKTHPGFLSITEEDFNNVHGDNITLFLWNGPRTFVFSGFEQQQEYASSSEGEELFEYGSYYPDGSGFIMVKAASLGYANETYKPTTVQRGKTAFYEAGLEVYELVGPPPTCIKYTMQSFLSKRDYSSVMSMCELRDLASRLDLPEGWTYRVRVLEEDFRIFGVNGATNITQDSMGNSYSQWDTYSCDDEVFPPLPPTMGDTPSPDSSARSLSSLFRAAQQLAVAFVCASLLLLNR